MMSSSYNIPPTPSRSDEIPFPSLPHLRTAAHAIYRGSLFVFRALGVPVPYSLGYSCSLFPIPSPSSDSQRSHAMAAKTKTKTKTKTKDKDKNKDEGEGKDLRLSHPPSLTKMTKNMCYNGSDKAQEELSWN